MREVLQDTAKELSRGKNVISGSYVVCSECNLKLTPQGGYQSTTQDEHRTTKEGWAPQSGYHGSSQHPEDSSGQDHETTVKQW